MKLKIYISYFYQVRFFTPEMVPFSTAKWDPKWFHNGGSVNYIFKDMRGVINGLRIEDLIMPDSYVQLLTQKDQMCHKGCSKQLPCMFMQLYKQYLDTLDFDYIMSSLLTSAHAARNGLPFQIVLLVHEAANCLCAERPVLMQWLREHDIEVEEWQPTVSKLVTTALF